jgi:hypothetical protein
LTIERVDDTHIRIVDYPATGRAHADLVVTLANGSVGGTGVVESQNSGGYTAGGFDTQTSGTAVLNCHGTISLDLTFVLTNAGASDGTYAGNGLVLEKQ